MHPNIIFEIHKHLKYLGTSNSRIQTELRVTLYNNIHVCKSIFFSFYPIPGSKVIPKISLISISSSAKSKTASVEWKVKVLSLHKSLRL